MTLVEPVQQYTTRFHSNLYLGGLKTFESITHAYDKLVSAYGIKLAQQAAAAIDRDRRQRTGLTGAAVRAAGQLVGNTMR